MLETLKFVCNHWFDFLQMVFTNVAGTKGCSNHRNIQSSHHLQSLFAKNQANLCNKISSFQKLDPFHRMSATLRMIMQLDLKK